MSGRGRVGINAGYQLLAQVAVLGLNLVASPIIVHGLGLEGFGLLVIVGVATNYFGFVELGLGRATVQLLARYHARQELGDVHTVLWTATGATLALGLVGGAALVAAAPLLVTHVFAVSAGLAQQAVWAFVLGAAVLVVGMQRDMASSVATAMERFDIVSGVTLAAGALQAAVNVGLVMWTASLIDLMLGGLAVQAAALVVYWAVAWKLVPGLFPPQWSADKLRSLVRFGGYVTVSQVVGSSLLVHLEKVLIGLLSAVEQLPYYSVSYSLAWSLTAVPISLVSVIYPAMTRLLANDDHAAIREALKRATRYVFVLLLGPVVLLVIYAPEILSAWMGAHFAVQASACLRVLSVAVLVNAFAWPSYQLLHAAGRADLTARYHVAELILHVPISVALISRAGVAGAAVASLLRVIIDSTLLTRAAARIVGMRTTTFAAEGAGRAIIVAVVFLPLALAARSWTISGSRWETLTSLGIVAVCYVSPVIWLGLYRDDRMALLLTAKALVSRSGKGRVSPQ